MYHGRSREGTGDLDLHGKSQEFIDFFSISGMEPPPEAGLPLWPSVKYVDEIKNKVYKNIRTLSDRNSYIRACIPNFYVPAE